MTHSLEIKLNGIVPKTNIEVELDINTNEIVFTETPILKDIPCIELLNNLATCFKEINKGAGEIESIELKKL